MILYFCNKHFNDFLEHQMSKDKLTSLLAIKMWNFYTILMQQPLFLHILIFFSNKMFESPIRSSKDVFKANKTVVL